jgi:hypothetical protein
MKIKQTSNIQHSTSNSQGIRAGGVQPFDIERWTLNVECSRRSPSGMALVITVILIAVVTFMAITFLAISRRERGAVTTTTDTTTAQLAADDALAAAEAQIIAHTLATTNPYNFGLVVSTNYINPYGFVANVANPTNVNYFYHGGGPVSANDFPQLLANLYYLPRAPVMISTNDPVQGRFYLDLNRNGVDEPNGWWPELGNDGFPIVNGGVTNYMNFVGDPEWIGVLQHPDQPYGPNNPFVARYAFIAVPVGNALDLNAIHNETIGRQVNSTNLGTVNDSFMRNQGVGSWEINLAAFLADLNTNEWLPVDPSSAAAPGYYQYNEPGGFNNKGIAFDDAISLLSYRYSYNYSTLLPVGGLNPNGIFTTGFIFPPFQNNIDYYSDGPLMTTPAGINDVFQNVTRPWAGADNTNHFFDLQELFDPNKVNVGAASPANSFTNRLALADSGPSTYDRYTYYRLLSQMGVDSAPIQNQINLNYSNAAAYFWQLGNLNIPGFVTNIVYYPGAETNLVPWTPWQFFTIAADKMLRAYSQEWLEENPSNYVATYCMTTNISTAPNPLFDPTNIPIPFGISDIPVLVSNQFVYTPAVQRVLQLAANMYDATTNNTRVMGADFPSVFRPIFEAVPFPSPPAQPVFTNVYIIGYEPVGSYYDANGQIELGTVTGPTDPQLALPVNVTDLQVLPPDFSIPRASFWTNINVYGVPWIIGAKKGFPNFNEFAMESTFQLTRKIQVWRPNTNDYNYNDYQYKQSFNLSLTNQFGAECWNSYSNAFLRSVAIYVTCANTCLLTNDEGFSTNLASLISGYLPINSTSNNNDGWPGYNPDGSGAPVPAILLSSNSFQIPLNTTVGAIPTSMYRFNVGPNVEEPGHAGPYLTTNLDYPWGNSLFESGVTINGQSYPQPHWWLTTSNGVRVIILDTTVVPNRVIDYVQLSGPNNTVDLTSNIIYYCDKPASSSGPSGTQQFNTNIVGGTLTGPIGMISQIETSLGAYPNGPIFPPWNESLTEQQVEIDGFLAFFGYSFPPGSLTAAQAQAVAEAQMTNAMQTPYTPTATIVQDIDWQANDPLVHYMANDLQSAPVPPKFLLPNQPSDWPLNLGSLNDRYQPWGGGKPINTNAPNPNAANAYNLALKDPLIWRSDYWDFPTYNLPTIGWLGRIHRGTPWQTVYLKSPDILQQTNAAGAVVGTNTWAQQWTGDTLLTYGQYYDAVNTAPTQDRLLFDLFTTAPNDNATRGQLSVNVGASDPANPQAGLAAWSALLSGVVMPTNRFGGYTIIQPAGPAGPNALLGALVTNINYTRANFTNADGLKGAFEHVGDVLAVPALTVSNQWLPLNNANVINGISDEMYEWFPQQVMSLLRVSGTPQSPMRYVIYGYGQALKPAPNGIYTGSGAYFGMVTNYQVVAESATRAVVNFGSVVTNLVTVTNDIFGNPIPVSFPAVTNNTAQIEQFNALAPY